MKAKIECKTVKQVVIDAGMHQILKQDAKRAKKPIKWLLESLITDDWARKGRFMQEGDSPIRNVK